MPEIDSWLRYLLKHNGSDLHLRSGMAPLVRIHGRLGTLADQSVLEEEGLTRIMREITPEERWRRFLETWDQDFSYALGDEGRFRVNFLRHHGGMGCVLHHIPSRVLTLEELGAPDVLRQMPHYRSGLVLVTGPTGSGKSTTLAAIIDEINRHYHKHVITVEDPIEFVHQNLGCLITQREVGTDTPEFAVALKDALREDPDVILVGEMRDLETVALAITLAETGALVFATLHTNSAAKTIDRIIDVFPPGRQEQVRTMLATSLKAIVAQQLLRQADGQGRVAAREILIGSPALSNIIRENRTERIPSYIQSGRDQGMITMDTTLRAYVEGGLVTGEEAYMFAHEKTLFQEFFHHDVSTKPARPAKEGSGVGPKPQAQGGAGPKPQAPTRPQGPAPKN